jgi:hypothetical protein
MRDRTGKLWTDEEFDVVARWVRSHRALIERVGVTSLEARNAVRALEAELRRSRWACELEAIGMAVTRGIKLPGRDTAQDWYRNPDQDGRRTAAWRRSKPESPDDLISRLGYGHLFEDES